MIVGQPSIFAIESGITEAYERLSFRALGFFVIHVGGQRYGVYKPDATLLACSFDEVGDRISRRVELTAPFAAELDAGKIADAVCNAIYAEEPDEGFFGIPQPEFRDLIYSNHLLWVPDGDEAFDDGSYVLQFDVEDRVRLIAFKTDEGYRHDPKTLSAVWLAADDFYQILQHWHDAFEAEWTATSKTSEDELVLRRSMNDKYKFQPIHLPEPWGPRCEGLEQELSREVAPGHPLYQHKAVAIARRSNNDDVLFRVESPRGGVALVHLTWSGKPETPPCPHAEVFLSLDEWLLHVRDLPDNYAPPKTAQELLQRYASGERVFLDLGKEDDFVGDFSNADLRGIALSGFIDADFTGANLEKATLFGNLKTCIFRKANLAGALFQAAIDAADFEGAILEGADFTGSSAYSHVFKENEKP